MKICENRFFEETQSLWFGNDVPVLTELTSCTDYRLAGFRRFLDLLESEEDGFLTK